MHEVAGREHPSPGGGPEAALDAAPRHQPGGIGMDAPAAHPPVCLQGLTVEQLLPPCMPLRCYCRATAFPDTNTMPKLALAVNVLSHAWSSHSGGGMAQASLNDEDTWDDDFQTPHTPVHSIIWREDDSLGEPVDGGMEALRGSPGWHTGYQVHVGEEETINPTWRTTHWLQLAVQGISDDEVPWYELVIPLMVGTEGTALSLAKCLLMIWRWSVKVLGWDVCPPTPTALNIGQFMTKEEVSGM